MPKDYVDFEFIDAFLKDICEETDPETIELMWELFLGDERVSAWLDEPCEFDYA